MGAAELGGPQPAPCGCQAAHGNLLTWLGPTWQAQRLGYTPGGIFHLPGPAVCSVVWSRACLLHTHLRGRRSLNLMAAVTVSGELLVLGHEGPQVTQ